MDPKPEPPSEPTRPSEPCLGFFPFYASSALLQRTDHNGLPVIAASIEINGRFQALRALTHPNLCVYYDIKKGEHDQMITMSECFPQSLNDFDLSKYERPQLLTMVMALAQQVLEALAYLAEHNIVVHNLQPSEIRIVQTNPLQVRLSNYGLYAMTHDEYLVDFPIGHPHYLPPEALLVWVERRFEDPAVHVSCLPTVDMWSLGVILCEMLTGAPFWNKGTTLSELFTTLERLYHDFGTDEPSGPPCTGVKRWKQIRKSFGYSSLNHECAFTLLDQYDSHDIAHNVESTTDRQEAALIELIFDCLLPAESERPSTANLLQRSFFNPIMSNLDENIPLDLNFIPDLRSQAIPSPLSLTKPAESATVVPASLTKVTLDTLYYLWTVAEGRPELVCAEHFGPPRVAPIEQLPNALGMLIPEPHSPAPTDPSATTTFTTAVDTSFLYHGKTAIVSRPDMIRFINSGSTIRYNVNVDHFDDGETVAVDFLAGTEETAEELLDSALIIQFT
ncbi:hypothetical protein IWQ61_007310, partial [Dispira simplex]